MSAGTVSFRQGRFPSMVQGTQGMHRGAWNTPLESAGTTELTPERRAVDEDTHGTTRRPRRGRQGMFRRATGSFSLAGCDHPGDEGLHQ